MNNKEELQAVLDTLKTQLIKQQKRGLHFILASVPVWAAVLAIQLSPLPVTVKNLCTFICSTPLVPFAYVLSKLLHIDFQSKDNPLSGLGLLFTMNQMLYLLVAMWVYAAVPEKMLMVYAMIFGAHLLPYGWLYQSKSYYVFSLVIPFAALLLGCCLSAVAVAVFMLVAELVFCLCLSIENRSTPQFPQAFVIELPRNNTALPPPD